jgi:hypothetical protein
MLYSKFGWIYSTSSLISSPILRRRNTGLGFKTSAEMIGLQKTDLRRDFKNRIATPSQPSSRPRVKTLRPCASALMNSSWIGEF